MGIAKVCFSFLLLVDFSFCSIDRITFKSAFEAGVAAQKSGKLVGSVTKTKCEKKPPVKAFKTPMKPKQCPPGPPVATQHQGNKVSVDCV